MANAISYIKNVGKSIGYASVSVLKEKNPVFADFAETNEQITRSMYKSIRNIKINIKKLPSYIMDSKYGEFGKTYLDNLMDDLKTGKFYNKEREDEYMNTAADSFTDGFDMDVFNDFGDGDINLDDIGDDISSNDMMNMVGEKSSTAVATAVARSAEYMVEASTEITKKTHNKLNIIYGSMHTGISTINQNITKILEYYNENMNLHFENSKTFYTEMTRMNQEQTQYLKEISDTLKVMNEPPKSSDNKRTNYTDLISSEGVVDLENYFKYAKKNLIENSGLSMLVDAIKMAESAGGLKTFAASPLQFAVEGMVNAIIPKALDKSMETLNKSLSGLAANLLMTMKQKSEDIDKGGGIWTWLNDIFGIDTERRTSIDPGRYEKGKVPFDGITRKAIIEVIPTYLSKILSALTGNKRDTFDYDSGKFVTLESLDKKIKDMTVSGARSAASEMDEVFREKVESLNLNSQELKAFKEFWEETKLELYKDQKRLETRDKNFELSHDPTEDKRYTKMLKEMFDGTSANMAYANRMYNQIASQSRQMESMQGSSSITALFNEDPSINKEITGISGLFSNANQAIVDKLNEIHKELAYIRIYGVGGYNKGKKKVRASRNVTRFEDFQIPIPQVADRESETPSNENGVQQQDTEEAAPSITIPQDKSKMTLEDIEAVQKQWQEYNNYKKRPEDYKGKKIPQKPEISPSELERLKRDIQRKKDKDSSKKKTLSDRIADLKKGALGIVQGPMNAVAPLIDRVDARLYELVYGPITGKEENDDRTLKEIFFDKIEDNMNKITDFVQEKIIDPLTTKSLKENAHDAAKKFLSIFGIDLDKSIEGIKKFLFGEDEDGNRTKGGFLGKFVNDFKDAFKSMGDWIKGGFKEAGDWTGVTSKKNEKGATKDSLKKGTDNYTEQKAKWDLFQSDKEAYKKKYGDEEPSEPSLQNSIQESIKEHTAKFKNIPNAAEGAYEVEEGGLTVISPGETVIPPDNDPKEINKRYNYERKIKRDLINKIKSANEFAEGNLTKEQYKAQQRAKRINENIVSKSGEERDKYLETLFKYYSDEELAKVFLDQKYVKDDYEKGRNKFTERMMDEAGAGVSYLFSRIKQAADEHFTVNEEDSKRFKDNASNVLKDIFGNTGTLAAGAVTGAGVSLLTGMIGGPLFGAAVGAGTALLTKSKTVQKLLFGDDEGNQGLLPKNMVNTIKKYLPNMGLGGAMGGIISMIPGIPGGPVAGIVVGSALGFAKNSEKAQEFLFGEGSILGSKESFQKKVKSVLPKMGAGALAGLIAGPFSTPANIIVGSALGFASDTEMFKNVLFGEVVDPETGRREGGIFDVVAKPMAKFFKDLTEEFKTFIKDDIIAPVRDAIDPFKKRIELLGKGIFDLIGKFLKNSIFIPIEKTLEHRFLKPLGKLFNTLFTPAKGIFKGLVSLPFKAIGGVGDMFRRHDIKSGNADYMSAAERVAYRESKGWRMKWGDPRDDRFHQLDKSMVNVDDETLETAQSALSGIKNAHKSTDELRQDAFKNISKSLRPRSIDYDTARAVKRMIQNGDYDGARRFVENANIENAQVKNNLLRTINAESEKIKKSYEYKQNAAGTIADLGEQLRKSGIDLDDATIEKMAKGDKEASKILSYIQSELKYRKKHGTVESEEVKQERKTDEFRDKLTENTNKIIQLLEKLNGITEEATDMKGDQTSGDQTDFLPPAIIEEEEGNRTKNFFKNKAEKIKARYHAKGPLWGTLGLAKDTAFDTVRGTWKLGKKAVKFGTKAAKFAANEALSGYDTLRDSPFFSTMWGDRSVDWHNPEEEKEVHTHKSKIAEWWRKRRHKGKSTEEESDSPLLAIEDLSSNMSKLTSVVLASAYKDGIDIDEIDDNGDPQTLINRIKNKFSKIAGTVVNFYNGHALKYRRNSNGDVELDNSSSENKEELRLIEQEKQEQKNMLATISNVPSVLGGLFSKFFSGDEEEKESWFSKLVGKIPSALKIATAFGVVGWASEKIFPAIKMFWDDKLAPYMNEAWNGRKEGFGKFIYFFNPQNPEGLLGKLNYFVTEKLPSIIKTAATYISTGVKWAMENVLPTVVAALIENIGPLLKGLAKGIITGVDNLIHRDVKNNDGTMKDLDNLKSNLGNRNYITPTPKPDWFDKSINTYSYNKINTISYNPNGIQNAATETTDTNKSTEKKSLFDNLFKKKLDPSLPKAFENVGDGHLNTAKREYEKVKDNVIETPYGNMTVTEILNSDKEFAVDSETGQSIRGTELLKYGNTSQLVGMNIKLTPEELRQNTLEHGGNVISPTQKDIAGAMGRSALRGLFNQRTGVKGASKIIKGTSNAIGNILSKGDKKRFIYKAMNHIGDETADFITAPNRFGRSAGEKLGIHSGMTRIGATLNDNLVKKYKTIDPNFNFTYQLTDTAASATRGSSVLGKFGKSLTTTLQKFIKMGTEALGGFLRKSKVMAKILDAFSDFAKTSSKALKTKIDDFILRICKELPEILAKYGGKAGLEAGMKIAGYIASGSLLMIADAVFSFFHGWNNADSMLKITEEPGLIGKLICGLLNALNNVFCLGLVPIEFLLKLITDSLASVGINFAKELQQKQDEAKKEVEEYNKEHGTNFKTIEEYNKRNSLWSKTKSVIAKLFNKDKPDDENQSIKTTTTTVDLVTSTYVNQNSINGRGSGLFGRGSNDHQVEGPNFISQVDPKYRNIPFNVSGDSQKQTLGDSGCAPAAAAMAVNSSYSGGPATMEDASKLALKYKAKDDGVRASYFEDEFSRYGLQAQYSSSSSDIKNQLKNNNKVVLMGQDRGNTSKANSPFGPNPHYVTATGMSRDGQYVYINDPEASRPNIKYRASKVLGSSKLGIAAARGSKLISNRFRKYIARGSYGSDTVQYKVWHALRDAGYNEIAVAAAMGNIQHESGFNVSAIEKGSGAGFGLIQWTKDRRTAIENYAAQRGVSVSDLGIQIEYLLKELDANSGIWSKAKSDYNLGELSRNDWVNGTDLVKATQAFMCCFERPSYDPNKNHIDRRIQSAQEYYQAFTGQSIDVNWNSGMTSSTGLDTSMLTNTTTSGTTSSLSNASEFLSGVTNAFGQLANASFNKLYGLNLPTTSSSSSGDASYNSLDTSNIGTNGGLTYNNTVQSAAGNVSKEPLHAKMQKKLVEQMYAIQGKLRYAQGNAKYPGSRNPEDGSGDCSSTVQWAYKKILGADPGSWTGAQRTDSDTFTVRSGPNATKDESWLQLGDLLLKDGHVEMYAGNNTMIGHGGGKDGKVPGPTVKKLDQSGKYDLVRRWVGFSGQNANVTGNGSGIAYDNALHYISDTGRGSDNSSPLTIPYGVNNGPIINNNIPSYAARSNVATPNTSSIASNNMIDLIKSIIKLLTGIVENTSQLNNIVKLLGDFMSATSIAATTGTQESKDNATLAKQTFINAMQNTGASNGLNTQLLRLIEDAEMVAKA